MSDARKSGIEAGMTDLAERLGRSRVEIIEHRRPWPDRHATYLRLGKATNQTDIALPDTFLCDLPSTREHQAAVDSYASAVGGRIRCGSPELFYCRSGVSVRIEIHWPINTTGPFSSWLRVDVTDQSSGKIAICLLHVRSLPYAETEFDDVRQSVDRIRKATDKGVITFYERENHPPKYQEVKNAPTEATSKPSAGEIERFLAGKAYWLGFGIVDKPGEAWIADPWDAEYLSVVSKELSQAAYILQARDLIELDSTLAYARPSNKLLTGWPTVLDALAAISETKQLSLSSLPKKEQLLGDITDALKHQVELALLVIDLDNFKSVNDTYKRHLEGDACLERVVQAIGRVVGRRGTLYRWGGDEFAVSLIDFSTEEAHATAERIRRIIEESKPGNEIRVTTSIGVSGSDRMKKASAEDLLDAADKAMYASKHGGKNRVTSWPVDDGKKDVVS